jgi:hypothetical protein
MVMGLGRGQPTILWSFGQNQGAAPLKRLPSPRRLLGTSVQVSTREPASGRVHEDVGRQTGGSPRSGVPRLFLPRLYQMRLRAGSHGRSVRPWIQIARSADGFTRTGDRVIKRFFCPVFNRCH